jgi:hypothetical protein
MTSAREYYMKEVGSALTDWRLGCIALRQDRWREQALYRDGLAEIIALRLRIAYMPIFQTLARIEARVTILADLREEPYAPRPRRFPVRKRS